MRDQVVVRVGFRVVDGWHGKVLPGPFVVDPGGEVELEDYGAEAEGEDHAFSSEESGVGCEEVFEGDEVVGGGGGGLFVDAHVVGLFVAADDAEDLLGGGGGFDYGAEVVD